MGCPGSLFYNPHTKINTNASREKGNPEKKRTLILFILCTNSPPILPPFLNLLSAAANIDVVDQMPCAICGGRKVIRAPPYVVDNELEVIRCR